MPSESRLLLKRALLMKLKCDSPLTELVPADSIFGQRVAGEPAWPFIRLGPPLSLSFRQSCRSGVEASLDVHVFAKDRYEDGDLIETGEEFAERIGKEVQDLLHEANIPLEDRSNARLRLSNVQNMPDESPDSFHWFAQCNARILADTTA